MKYAGRDKTGFNMRPQDSNEIGFMGDFVGKHITCKPATNGEFRFELAPEPEPTVASEPEHDTPAPTKARPRKSDAS